MNFMAKGLTGLGSSSMATDPRFQNYSILRPEEEEKKYGKDGMAFSKNDAEGYAKDVQQYYNYIMKNQFR